MQQVSDIVVDHARRVRQLVWWRAGAIVLFLLALLGPGIARFGSHHAAFGLPHIARLRISGVITDDNRRVIEALDRARDDGATHGLVLAIDSPGGAVTGGEQLHDAIARFAAKKPVVVSMAGLGASAGYMIAVPAARVFALPSTLTGSIGVIMESADMSGLLGKIGVGMNVIVSGPLKGQPSPTTPLSPAGRDMLQGIVNDLFDQFVGMVAQGRHMPVARVRALADGRPYTGRQALGLGLIDEIGNEAAATSWLQQNLGQGGSHHLPVVPLLAAHHGVWWTRFRPGSVMHLLPGMTPRSLAGLWLGVDEPVAILQP